MTSLVEITERSHPVKIELHYADERNFTGKPIYQTPRCFLHPDAEKMLNHAIEQADNLGLQFIIYDAYRPPKAQFVLWSHTPDPNFLADPHRGSPHSRGVAIDLTLADKETGEILDMGTPFDSFDPKSWHYNYEVSREAQRNRLILLGIMTNAGFDNYQHEWWHYQLFKARDTYPLVDDEWLGVNEYDWKNLR